MDISKISISDYNYNLPESRIAQYPLEQRDTSQLLVVNQDSLEDRRFSDLDALLPEGALMVRNNTKVIHARLHFQKASGAHIEIFCLEPLAPFTELNQALQSGSGCEWKCFVGNARKWKSGMISLELIHDNIPVTLYAEKLAEESGAFRVRFSWTPTSLHWSQLLESAGKIPLPPYISRESVSQDEISYQTIYACNEGSVAAPTAGLHFSENVMQSLSRKGIQQANVTLHVGAGTFKPVSTDLISEHRMHQEPFVVHRSDLEAMLDHQEKIVSVGTTSLRSLESIFLIGAGLNDGVDLSKSQSVAQWEPYAHHFHEDMNWGTALERILYQLQRQGIQELKANTQLMILPGYTIKSSSMLLTNFHQPKSTLLLLVAAFAGPAWKQAYQHALDSSYRFLSYGDACLFHRHKQH